MKLTLKKNADKKEVAEIEKRLYDQKRRKGFNAKKYNGALSSIEEDPLTVQEQLRNEWERDPG